MGLSRHADRGPVPGGRAAAGADAPPVRRAADGLVPARLRNAGLTEAIAEILAWNE